jgi:hypothetical protein
MYVLYDAHVYNIGIDDRFDVSKNQSFDQIRMQKLMLDVLFNVSFVYACHQQIGRKKNRHTQVKRDH